jgi:hypothetical protein
VQDFDDHVLASVKRDNIQFSESMKLREICEDDTLGEAFAYQSLITPRFAHSEPSLVELAHDWPAYASEGKDEVLVPRPTTVRYTPPTFSTVASFGSFATTYISCVLARLDLGDVRELESRRSYVLPVSG